MNTHDIELPPLPELKGGWAEYWTKYVHEKMQDYALTAIEADRQERQSEAEEVCCEAYLVVGSLLSDLGIFETHHAEKVLDNLSQAKMVHDDVLPWPSFDRRCQGEVVVTKTPEGEIIAVTRQDDECRILSVIAEADRQRSDETDVTQMVKALERIMTWPDGGNRYGQANIKVFAAEALAAIAAEKREDER